MANTDSLSSLSVSTTALALRTRAWSRQARSSTLPTTSTPGRHPVDHTAGLAGIEQHSHHLCAPPPRGARQHDRAERGIGMAGRSTIGRLARTPTTTRMVLACTRVSGLGGGEDAAQPLADHGHAVRRLRRCRSSTVCLPAGLSVRTRNSAMLTRAEQVRMPSVGGLMRRLAREASAAPQHMVGREHPRR